MSWRKSVALAVLALVALPNAGLAQETQNFVQVRVTKVKLGMEGEYEAFKQKVAEALKKNKSTNQIFVQSPGPASPGGVYITATVFSDWATFAANPMVEAFGQSTADAELAKVQAAIEHTQTQVMRSVPEWALPPAEDAPDPDAIYEVWIDLKPGGLPGFAQWVAKVREANQKTAPDTRYLAFTNVAGPGFDVAFIVPLTFAQLSNPPPPIPERLATAFGAAEAQRLMALNATVVEKVEIRVRRPRPELGYLPEE